MRSDAFSLVGGVRALVVDESEGELLLTYRNSLPDPTILHVHGVNPQQNARGNTVSKVLYAVTVYGKYTLEGTDFPKTLSGEDGFPLFKSWLIAPGESKHVQYALRQTGTYFLHAHLSMQQEAGNTFSIVLYIVNLYSKYSWALIFRNFCQGSSFH